MEKGFKGLTTWQKAYKLALEIYKITKGFPKHEQYALTSQIHMTAKGSLGELETYLMFAKDLRYISEEIFDSIDSKRKEVARLLQGLIKSLR